VSSRAREEKKSSKEWGGPKTKEKTEKGELGIALQEESKKGT